MTRAARERQLLRIAAEVFTNRGFVDTTMDEIADRAGITKPVIYDHFGSKEGLLAACVATASDDVRRVTMAAWQVERPGATIKDYLRESARAFLDYVADNDVSFRLIHDLSAASAAGAAAVDRMRADQVSASVDILRRAAALRERPIADVEAIAEIVVGIEDRLVGWRLRHPETTIEEAAEIVAAVIWGGLRGFIVPR